MKEPSLIKLSTPVRVILGVFLSILSGIAFTLAFPPYEIWILVFVGWIPLQIAQFRILPKRISSLASSIALFVWLQGYLGPVFTPVGTFMVWLPLGVSLLNLLMEAGLRKFHQDTGFRWFIPSGITNWAGSEMIRLFLPIAGTWAFIAYPLYRQVWFIQPVSIFGIIGLGVLIIFINLSLALLLIAWLDSSWKFDLEEPDVSFRMATRWAVVCGIALVLWTTTSLIQYNSSLDTPLVTVAAIQPAGSAIINANQGHVDVAVKLRNRMVEQSRDAASRGAKLIVWPEGSLMVDPQLDVSQVDFVSLAKESGAYLVPGYVVNMENGFRNEATVVDPRGEFLGVFGKDHPVTFGGETSLSRGTYPVYETIIGKLATINAMILITQIRPAKW